MTETLTQMHQVQQVQPQPQQMLQLLQTWVVKTGVSLGGLTDPQRQVALSLAATALPAGAAFSEAQVNQALKGFLGAAGQFLDTDHVELRRWLVDTGWWQRDGFGRAYVRSAAAALTLEQQALQVMLANLGDAAAWAALERSAAQAQRDARRSAWAARQTR